MVVCCGQSTELIWVTALNYWLLIEDASTCQGQTRCSAEITNGQRHPGSSVFANTNWIKVFQQNTSTRKKCLPFPECSMVVFLNSMFVHCPMIIPTSGYCPSVHYLSPISPCWWPCHHRVTKASPMPPMDTTLCSMTRPMRRESLCPGRAFVLGTKYHILRLTIIRELVQDHLLIF